MRIVSIITKVSIIVFFVLLVSTAAILTAYIVVRSDYPDLPPPPPMTAGTQNATRPAYCAPIPHETLPIGLPTPTPNILTLPVPTPPHSQGVTPIPFSHIYDLSPQLPQRDKCEIIVFRCNGAFDQFWAAPDIDIHRAIALAEGDIILNSIPPASLMGHEPPPPPTDVLDKPAITTPRMASPYPPPALP